jgi:hypothetical protein
MPRGPGKNFKAAVTEWDFDWFLKLTPEVSLFERFGLPAQPCICAWGI